MKAVLLAGGLGTRLSEETALKPKPMVEIGGKPILWHIMSIYAAQGFDEFVVCLGYKGQVVKEYFANYTYYSADITIGLRDQTVTMHKRRAEDWTVTLVDTGADAMTGGRVKAVAPYLENQPFFLTYGDGVADIDIRALHSFHRNHGKLATVTAVQPPGRFGVMDVAGDQVTGFREKFSADTSLINGGFFVLEPGAIDYIEGSDTVWEQEPMNALTRDEQLMAFRHGGFWHPMDTLRDKTYLEKLIEDGSAPWMKLVQQAQNAIA